jgi:hypothetical protein
MFKNHVDLIGFIGSDAEQRQLENSAQLTSLSLATKTPKRAGRTIQVRTTAAPSGIESLFGASSPSLRLHSRRALTLKLKASSGTAPIRRRSRPAKRPSR